MKGPAPALVAFWRTPNLPMIEGRRTIASPRGYKPHTHPTYSIGLVDSGESRVRIGETSLRVGAGALVFVPEGLVHSCNPVSGSLWSYRMLYVDPGWLRRRRLLARFGGRGPAGVAGSAGAAEAFDAIEALLRSEKAGANAEKTLARLLADLFERAPGRGEPKTAAKGGSPLETVKAHLQERLFETVTLAELSLLSGLEKYRLVRSFRRYTGLTPHAYQLDLRVSLAKEMLREGRSLAETAYVLGFADQSHFQRAFKPRVAATPGEFSGRRSRRRA